MKLKCMLALACVPLLALADINITAREKVSQKMMPNILEGAFHFSEDNKNADVIKEHLNALVATVKQFDQKSEICKGGGYQIVPQYTYNKENKRTFIGYSGSLSFECAFKSVEDHNALLTQIDKAKVDSVIVTQGQLMWRPSESEYNKAYLSLRSSILEVAQKQAELFSKELKMACEVSVINFADQGQSINPVLLNRAASSMSYKAAPTQEPIQHDISVLLQADVAYVCKKGK